MLTTLLTTLHADYSSPYMLATLLTTLLTTPLTTLLTVGKIGEMVISAFIGLVGLGPASRVFHLPPPRYVAS